MAARRGRRDAQQHLPAGVVTLRLSGDPVTCRHFLDAIRRFAVVDGVTVYNNHSTPGVRVYATAAMTQQLEEER